MQDEKKIPRGIRNNNPLNIRRGKTPWFGEVHFEKDDKSFCQFQTLELGWRAAFYLIRKKMLKYIWGSIKDVVMEWAPPCENHTDKYIEFVSNMTGLSATEKFHYDNIAFMFTLACAMCAYENGVKYYPLRNPEWERKVRIGRVLDTDVFVLDCYMRDLGDKIEVYDWGV